MTCALDYHLRWVEGYYGPDRSQIWAIIRSRQFSLTEELPRDFVPLDSSEIRLVRIPWENTRSLVNGFGI